MGVAETLQEATDLQDCLEQFAKRNKFEKYRIMTVDEGNQVDKIVQTVQAGEYDAVATLSDKTSGFMRLFVGDDIEEMVGELDVPVLSLAT